MKIIKVENPVYSRSDRSTIDCVVTFESGQVYPYTAAAHDPMVYGQELHADLIAGKHGEIKPFGTPVE